jgi:hypothetical protein
VTILSFRLSSHTNNRICLLFSRRFFDNRSQDRSYGELVGPFNSFSLNHFEEKLQNQTTLITDSLSSICNFIQFLSYKECPLSFRHLSGNDHDEDPFSKTDSWTPDVILKDHLFIVIELEDLKFLFFFANNVDHSLASFRLSSHTNNHYFFRRFFDYRSQDRCLFPTANLQLRNYYQNFDCVSPHNCLIQSFDIMCQILTT